MPRPNHTRTLGSEDALARRIARERGRRGMTYEALASAMTNAGVSVDKSAIYRIEKGKPRRSISVDELIALAQVFDTTVDDLLRPVEVLEREWAESLARDFIAAAEALDDAHAGLVRAAVGLARAAADAPDVAEFAINRWRSQAPGRQWFGEFTDDPLVSWQSELRTDAESGREYYTHDLLTNLAAIGLRFWDSAVQIVEDVVKTSRES